MVPSLFDLDGTQCDLVIYLHPLLLPTTDAINLQVTIRDQQGRIVMQRSDKYEGAQCDYLPTVMREVFDAYLWGERWQQVRQAMKRLHSDAVEYEKTIRSSRGDSLG